MVTFLVLPTLGSLSWGAGPSQSGRVVTPRVGALRVSAEDRDQWKPEPPALGWLGGWAAPACHARVPGLPGRRLHEPQGGEAGQEVGTWGVQKPGLPGGVWRAPESMSGWQGQRLVSSPHSLFLGSALLVHDWGRARGAMHQGQSPASPSPGAGPPGGPGILAEEESGMMGSAHPSSPCCLASPRPSCTVTLGRFLQTRSQWWGLTVPGGLTPAVGPIA